MPAAKSDPRARLRALPRANGGATAVEFAMVGVPFFALLFTIVELGMMFMSATALQAATDTNARLIRTGQLQQGSDNSAGGFKTLFCNSVSWISTSDCLNNLSVNVQTYASFSAMNVNPPITNGAIDQTQLTFNSGASCSIELVQVYYPYSLITPLLEPGMPNLGGNQRLIATAVAFRNENWAGQGAPCT
jgi:Flp pilus assembly protein TadG